MSERPFEPIRQAMRQANLETLRRLGHGDCQSVEEIRQRLAARVNAAEPEVIRLRARVAELEAELVEAKRRANVAETFAAIDQVDESAPSAVETSPACACVHCGAVLTDEEIEFYTAACNDCEEKISAKLTSNG